MALKIPPIPPVVPEYGGYYDPSRSIFVSTGRPFNPVPPTKQPADISSGAAEPGTTTTTTTGGGSSSGGGGSSSGGSSAPYDYMGNILNDPIYKQEMAAIAAQGIASAAQRKGSIDRALIGFGEVPNLSDAISGLGLSPSSGLFSSINTDVDQMTRDAAAGLTQSGLSTVAKLATGHTTALDTLMSQLAARGIVRSGATGVGVGLENTNYAQGQYDARSNLLSYLSGVQQAWEQAKAQQDAAAALALENAANRQMTLNPPPAAGPTSTATTPADWGGSDQNWGILPPTVHFTQPWEQ